MRLETERVFGLDLLRAMAIGLVLLGHVTLFFPAARAVFGYGLLAGYFGVELFFVLSGFLIGGILFRQLAESGGRIHLSRFWQRRWLRTLPNYFLFLLVNLALAGWLQRSIPSGWRYVLFLQNITSRPPPFFVESWSLAVEEWFYMLLPILLLAAVTLTRNRVRVGSFAVVCGVILLVTLLRIHHARTSHSAWLTDVRMTAVYRLDACMFGVLGAWTKHFFPELWWRLRRQSALVGLGLLGCMAVFPFLAEQDTLFPQTLGFSLTSAGALLLLPSLDAVRAKQGLTVTVVTRISLWSYSLYLVNLPVRTILVNAFPTLASPVAAVLFAACSIAGAAIAYCLFERPILTWRDRLIANRPGAAERRAQPEQRPSGRSRHVRHQSGGGCSGQITRQAEALANN